MTTSVLADENYNDISNEYSDGPREPPEDWMAREKPRKRTKDWWFKTNIPLFLVYAHAHYIFELIK
jgi:hypothetical protein